MMRKYAPQKLSEGFDILSFDKEIYFIANPALGLWAEKALLHKTRFVRL